MKYKVYFIIYKIRSIYFSSKEKHLNIIISIIYLTLRRSGVPNDARGPQKAGGRGDATKSRDDSTKINNISLLIISYRQANERV